MNDSAPRPLARRTPLVLAALMLIAVVGFALVSRLVTRLRANEKQIAWHAYEAGLAEVQAGRPERALDDFRAALVYDTDNSTYQLNLARALRETGRLNESEVYLLHLWNAAPQDSTINLALARLAARRGSVDDALRYYNNAIYGVWASNPDQNRRHTRFEVIEFLLKENASPQAQAELLALAQVLPSDPGEHLKVAKLFAEARDYPNALQHYQLVLKLNGKDPEGLAGAGEAAFQSGRYRTAERYLQERVRVDPEDVHARELLQTATLVLDSDPFSRRISELERNRRIQSAFTQAGDRLKNCAQAKGIDLSGAGNSAQNRSAPGQGSEMQALWNRWQRSAGGARRSMGTRVAGAAARPDLRLGAPNKVGPGDNLMDIVLEIEKQTALECGDPSGRDLALLLISRDRGGVDQ
jgi:tetratricopeptide (TPR) repeat protein